MTVQRRQLSAFDVPQAMRSAMADWEARHPYAHAAAQPGFHDLARALVEQWAPPADKDEMRRSLVTLLRDLGGVIATTTAIYLEATPGGLTLARLRDLMLATGTASAGRARALMIYLRFLGFIEPETAHSRGRTQRFRTTEKLRHFARERARGELRVRAGVDPAIATVLARLDEPEIFTRLYVALVEQDLARVMAAPQRDLLMTYYFERFLGFPILLVLMQTGAPDDVFPPRGPLDYSVSEVARRCHTSRTQVGRIIGAAREHGVLVPTADGRERFSEAALVEFDGLIAGGINGVLLACRTVLGQPLRLYGETELAL